MFFDGARHQVCGRRRLEQGGGNQRISTVQSAGRVNGRSFGIENFDKRLGSLPEILWAEGLANGRLTQKARGVELACDAAGLLTQLTVQLILQCSLHWKVHD